MLESSTSLRASSKRSLLNSNVQFEVNTAAAVFGSSCSSPSPDDFPEAFPPLRTGIRCYLELIEGLLIVYMRATDPFGVNRGAGTRSRSGF